MIESAHPSAAVQRRRLKRSGPAAEALADGGRARVIGSGAEPLGASWRPTRCARGVLQGAHDGRGAPLLVTPRRRVVILATIRFQTRAPRRFPPPAEVPPDGQVIWAIPTCPRPVRAFRATAMCSRPILKSRDD